MGRDRAIVLCGILAAIYIAIGIPYGFQLWSLPARAVTYHFFHANVFHLIANGFCLWQICKRGMADNQRLLTSFIVASLIPFVYHGQMVGFSNILYVLTGLAVFSFSRKSMGILLLATAVMMLFPQIAGIPHFIALCVGIIIAYLNRRLQRLNSDISAATY